MSVYHMFREVPGYDDYDGGIGGGELCRVRGGGVNTMGQGSQIPFLRTGVKTERWPQIVVHLGPGFNSERWVQIVVNSERWAQIVVFGAGVNSERWAVWHRLLLGYIRDMNTE